jgi:transposase
MESTGKYWIPVYNILEPTCRVVLAHPKYVKAIRGKKTDKKDAKWIADLFKHDIVSGSFIPPLEIRQLRDLMRYRTKLTQMNCGEKNRVQNCLTVSNFKLDDVFSDVFGVSATQVIDQILEHPDGKFDVSPYVSKRCRTPIAEIQAAVDGVMGDEQIDKLKVIRSHMDSLSACKHSLETQILELAAPYQKQLELLMTVPGIQQFSAIKILSEIGSDMSVFSTSKHLCSWVGLVPQNAESAGKKKTTRISRAGIYLKPLLVQCTLAVCNSDKHPEVKSRYLALKKRRGHKKAIIAICRMLLTSIYHILQKAEPYNPKLCQKKEEKPTTKLSLKNAVELLVKRGYFIVDSYGESLSP